MLGLEIYRSTLTASERVGWRLDDVFPAERRLDFARRFLPEALAGADALAAVLSPGERLALNHIRGHGYLSLFGLVEEFILPFVVDHARSRIEPAPAAASADARVRGDADGLAARAYLQFAVEEAKHIELFTRFRRRFAEGFGAACETVGPPVAVARAVLAHGALGVALAILHIEWMTQRHYTESVHCDEDLDPLFRSLLKHHWMEEAQHARLDAAMVSELAAGMSAAEVERGVAEYLDICVSLDALLAMQVELDLNALERVAGRVLSSAERDRVRLAQLRSMRRTFLASGMTHPRFAEALQQLSPAAAARVREAAAAA